MEIRYDQINTMDEIQFIGGSIQEFTFSLFDGDGVPIDITTATVTWNMAVYGIPNSIELTKTASVTPPNTFTVTLLPADTVDKSGKFIHQAVITIGGSTYIPSQGLITITPKIK